jgi:2-oxoisovalerate ferredoxin oxidoreductase beta subunit
MNEIFYERFDRHAHGEGLKARATHYCPGCGHGLAHKYLAQAIEKLGIQDRTVMVSPVGCAVFLYYYFDTGNTQAAHGRAPAVAIGHKVSNPESIVVSYQGDGDLASIGMAEILSAAQLGLPISVIFVNNAIYGMTGGQMAPTTLMGQKTSTSPGGRDAYMGQPLKMAELMAQLDGPVYVERVALFDAKQRVRASKAIQKALQCQVEGRGFAFVEVLAECPTHLKMTPEEAETWVRDTMTQVFPLGVKKDVEAPQRPTPPKPVFDPLLVTDAIGGSSNVAPRFCDAFPAYIAQSDIALKFAGAGGDGAQTAALLIAQAGINEGFDATHIPSYGPESRGGTSYADVHVAKEEVLSPSSPRPDILVAFNAPSLAKFAPAVRSGGTIVYDSSVIAETPIPPDGVKMIGIPFTGIATSLGKPVVKNVVALGALQAATNLFPPETFLTALRQALSDKAKVLSLNEEAFAKGQAAVG